MKVMIHNCYIQCLKSPTRSTQRSRSTSAMRISLSVAQLRYWGKICIRVPSRRMLWLLFRICRRLILRRGRGRRRLMLLRRGRILLCWLVWKKRSHMTLVSNWRSEVLWSRERKKWSSTFPKQNSTNLKTNCSSTFSPFTPNLTSMKNPRNQWSSNDSLSLIF